MSKTFANTCEAQRSAILNNRGRVQNRKRSPWMVGYYVVLFLPFVSSTLISCNNSASDPCESDLDCQEPLACDLSNWQCATEPKVPSQKWMGELCYDNSIVAGTSTPLALSPRACRYINTHAKSDDCKLYIGRDWEDDELRRADCGNGIVESEAHLIDECCPPKIGEEPPIGGCRIDSSTSKEVLTLVYGSNPAVMKLVCENYMSGSWEPNGNFADEVLPLHDPTDAAYAALASSDEQVQITHADCLDLECVRNMAKNRETFDFVPQTDIKAGIALYPGGRVDPRAYAVMARLLAERGIYVAVVAMEGFLSITGIDRADGVQAAHPEIEHWFVVGHSQGGAMSIANALTPAGDQKAGFVMWAARNGSSYDYSQGTKPVLTVWGTLDDRDYEGLIEANKQYLPANAEYVKIEGGIHHYYSDYTNYETAENCISRQEQQSQAIEATVDFIERVIQ